MRKLFFTLVVILISFSLFAKESRDSSWSLEGAAGLKLTQVSLSNWSAGGISSVAFDASFTYNADYNKGKSLWQNRLELNYGLTNNKGERTRKTNDKIYLSSNYGYKIYKTLYWSMLSSFSTQFYKGYNYGIEDSDYISRIMAPAYIVVGTGIKWTPSSIFTTTFTPASWRGTIVSDSRLSDEGAFGVKKGKHLLSEFGANLKAELNYEILKDIKLYSRLELFSNYIESPKNIAIQWDIQLNMIVNKWISATLTTNMVYDNDVKITQKDGTKGARVQFKEALGVGLQFAF